MDEERLAATPTLAAPPIPLQRGLQPKEGALAGWVDSLLGDIVLSAHRRKEERGFVAEWGLAIGPSAAAMAALDLAEAALRVRDGCRKGKWACSHAGMLAVELAKSLPPGEWLGERGRTILLAALRLSSWKNGHTQERHELVELACALGRASAPLTRDDFEILLGFPQQRPLRFFLEMEKAWRPQPEEAAKMALAACRELDAGKLWAIVRIERLARLGPAWRDEEESLSTSDREMVRRALGRGCALGADRSATELLCKWARPSVNLLAECVWSSLGMTDEGKRTREEAPEMFEKPESAYPSPADGQGGGAFPKQNHGRPIGALLSREEWAENLGAKMKLARDVAKVGLHQNNEGIFQVGFFHGSGAHPSDQAAAEAQFGCEKIAMWEAGLVSNASARKCGTEKQPPPSSKRLRL